jgi:PKD repeat protein
VAKLTGTFLGGPYDGDTETYDIDTTFIVREDPVTEEAEVQSYTAPLSVNYVELSTSCIYEWTQDDDGRGWWIPVGRY